MSDQPSDRAPIGDKRRRGLDKMTEVYGWEVSDGPGEFFGMTVEHLFGEVWQNEALSIRDRRLLIIGLLVGSGQEDVLDIQIPAALGNGEFDEDQLRQIVIMVAHYAGWPRGARINQQIEAIIARHNKAKAKEA